MEDYYALLNITKRATQNELKKAYRAKVKQYHPDLYNTESIVEQMQAEKMTIMINNAYEILSDTVKKNEKQNNTEQNKENEKNDIAIIINNHRYVLFKDFPLYFSLSSHIEEMEKHLIIIKRSHISLDDELIRAIAKTKPTTKYELRTINGITEDDINRHGDAIIDIVLAYLRMNDEKNQRK